MVLQGFDFEFEPIQQSGQVVPGKPGFLHPVPGRIYGKVAGCPEIGTGQIAAFERGPEQIASVEDGQAQVGFREIGFPELAIDEDRFFERQAEKGGVIQAAFLQSDLQAEREAGVEPKAEQLAFHKVHVLKGGLEHADVAQVAPLEGAIVEGELGKVGSGEVAADEAAIFIVSLYQRIFRKITRVERFI
jgi:hypothetical protein